MEVASQKSKVDDWRERWRNETAASARELVCLCLGWNPDDRSYPDPGLYNATLERILRAVRVGDIKPLEPIVQITREEFMFGEGPLFRLRDVAVWAKRHFPTTFPLSGDDTSTGGVTVHIPHTTPQLEALFRVMRKYWGNSSAEIPKQSAVAAAIDKEMGGTPQQNGEASRNAQALAALVRPAEQRAADRRFSRSVK